MEIDCKACGEDPRSEIEFYCKTCQIAICRNCLLLKHISFDKTQSDEVI